jgi:hypothetical protein
MRSLRLLPLVLLLIGLAPQVHAQFQFGVRAGLNVADFSGDDAGDTDPRLGFHAGVSAAFPFANSLFIRPEALYSQKGAGYTEDGDDVSFNIDYLDIPVLLGYTLPTRTNLLLQLYAGPQLSVKLSESVRAEGLGVDLDLVKSTDLGLVLGGDVGAVRVGSRQAFGVGLRYAFGLTDIIDASGLGGPDPTVSSDVRNRVLSVSAFYNF